MRKRLSIHGEGEQEVFAFAASDRKDRHRQQAVTEAGALSCNKIKLPAGIVHK